VFEGAIWFICCSDRRTEEHKSFVFEAVAVEAMEAVLAVLISSSASSVKQRL
jgi:hypothetical protein